MVQLTGYNHNAVDFSQLTEDIMINLRHTTLIMLPVTLILSVFPQIQIPPVHPEGLVYESDIGIITGVEIDGMIYFLKIIPHDTSGSIAMPMHRPERQYFYFGDDTMYFVLPDTVLRFVPGYR